MTIISAERIGQELLTTFTETSTPTLADVEALITETELRYTQDYNKTSDTFSDIIFNILDYTLYINTNIKHLTEVTTFEINTGTEFTPVWEPYTGSHRMADVQNGIIKLQYPISPSYQKIRLSGNIDISFYQLEKDYIIYTVSAQIIERQLKLFMTENQSDVTLGSIKVKNNMKSLGDQLNRLQAKAKETLNSLYHGVNYI